MASITLKGREIPLLYTVYEMKQIQEEIAPIGQALKIVLGKKHFALYLGFVALFALITGWIVNQFV